jgi:hypothetical protein
MIFNECRTEWGGEPGVNIEENGAFLLKNQLPALIAMAFGAGKRLSLRGDSPGSGIVFYG